MNLQHAMTTKKTVELLLHLTPPSGILNAFLYNFPQCVAGYTRYT